jgi:hypothetical protein
LAKQPEQEGSDVMEMYVAIVVAVVLVSLVIESPVARYLTGYSWPAAILLVLLSAMVFSLLGPFLALPYYYDVESTPTSENYLKLYVTVVFIKAVIDTFLLQFATTMFVSTSPNISAPPFMTTFKLLLAANIGVVAVVAILYAYNYLTDMIEVLGISFV